MRADLVTWLYRCRGEIGAVASGLAPEAYDAVKGSEARQQQWQLLLATAMRPQVTPHLQCQASYALSLPDCQFRLLKTHADLHKSCLLPALWACCAMMSPAADHVSCVTWCAVLISHAGPANTPRVLACRLTRHCQSQHSEHEHKRKERIL